MSGAREKLVITPRATNPPKKVTTNALANRRYNRFDKIEAYEYQAYNKLVLTMDNVTDKFLSSKLVRNIGKEVQEIMGDSTQNVSQRIVIEYTDDADFAPAPPALADAGDTGSQEV